MRCILLAWILVSALAGMTLPAGSAWCGDSPGSRTPEMQTALEIHESCLKGSDCIEMGHTNFSLPLRDVYTPPKH